VARRIRIRAGRVAVVATFDDSWTARAIWEALPLEAAAAQTWGDELYFSIPVTLPEESGRAVVEPGGLGYWPPGLAFCIFFGPTPVSEGAKVRPASPVNVFGRVDGDATAFEKVRTGTRVWLERTEPAASGKEAGS
jgi:uncharacterized protein